MLVGGRFHMPVPINDKHSRDGFEALVNAADELAGVDVREFTQKLRCSATNPYGCLMLPFAIDDTKEWHVTLHEVKS